MIRMSTYHNKLRFVQCKTCSKILGMSVAYKHNVSLINIKFHDLDTFVCHACQQSRYEKLGMLLGCIGFVFHVICLVVYAA